MNLTTETLKLWDTFDNYIKGIIVCCFLILILNIISLFFESGSLGEMVIHWTMLLITGGEFYFVYKELDLLKQKEKFQQL